MASYGFIYESHHASNESHHLGFHGGTPPMTVWDDLMLRNFRHRAREAVSYRRLYYVLQVNWN